MPIITLQLPNFPPVEHVLKDDAVTIGRMKGNLITLDDISVSLSHAKLTRRGGDYYLKDLNSTNGTMVNGQSITEVRLRDGDHVKFGEVLGRFYLAAGSPAPATPSAPSAPAAPVVVTPPAPPPPVAPVVSTAPDPLPAAAPVTAPVSAPASSPVTAPLPRPLSKPSDPAATVKAQKSLISSLAFKVVGLVVVALLLWKIAFKQDLPPAVPASRNSPPVSVKPMPSEKPPTPLPAAELGVAPGIPALVKSLKSPDAQERRRAVAALNALRAEALSAAPDLREALKDSDSEVRMWAALSLISNRVYDKASVPILIQTLQHDNATLRQVACLSLALFPYDDGDKEAVIVALTDCAGKDANPDVRNAALSALKMVAHEPAAK